VAAQTGDAVNNATVKIEPIVLMQRMVPSNEHPIFRTRSTLQGFNRFHGIRAVSKRTAASCVVLLKPIAHFDAPTHASPILPVDIYIS
jgi:hypothetical protein